MIKIISKEEKNAMIKWLNKNYRNLKQYAHEYIAYNEHGIIISGKDLHQVVKIAEDSEQNFSIYLVPDHQGSIVILPIHFRTLSRHDWQPIYQVTLKHNEGEINTTMIIDSGADFSVISHQSGRDLGFNLADSEEILIAQTIGGMVEYVLRRVEMMIDDHYFKAPVAWLQNNTTDVMVLGREVVFDKFDIHFKQADEEIIFTWREN